MYCKRCNKEFSDEIPTMNAEFYGANFFSCPHCGKMYHFYRKVVCVEVEDLDIQDGMTDDWEKKVVKDKDYKKEVIKSFG